MEGSLGNLSQDTLFVFLVEQFRIQAWISLGKIKNPVSDKIELNLDMAKQAIEMLRMLQTKTRGNLTGDEERLLKSALSDLQLNYVDELQKAQKKAKEKEAASPAEKEKEKTSEAEATTATASAKEEANEAEKAEEAEPPKPDNSAK